MFGLKKVEAKMYHSHEVIKIVMSRENYYLRTIMLQEGGNTLGTYQRLSENLTRFYCIVLRYTDSQVGDTS